MALPPLMHRSALRLEGLEAREVPTVHLSVSDHVLSIVGDAQSNVIHIRDNGDGQITVVAGSEKLTADDIHKISIHTGGGSDQVDYQLTGPLEVREKIVADLGTGADKAAFDFKDGIAATGHLNLVVRGGRGADQESVSMGDIAKGGSARINLHGGRGDDSMSFHSTGTVNGNLFVNLHKGPGDIDSIVTHVTVGPSGHVVVK